MSEYGSRLYDQNGRLFASTERESFHYWGCVDIQVDSNMRVVGLFNIPVSIPIAAFINVTIAPHNNFVDRGGLVELVNSGGVWAVQLRSAIPIAPATVAAFTRARIFVFVQAKYIPSASYGMQCFSASGVKTYDSSRPLLQICGFANVPDQLPLFFNRQTSLPASVMNHELTSIPLQWNRVIYNMRYYASQVDVHGGWGFTTLWDYTYFSPALPTIGVENVALIDGNYYLNFANIGYM